MHASIASVLYRVTLRPGTYTWVQDANAQHDYGGESGPLWACSKRKLAAHLPHVGLVDFAHGEPVKALPGLHHALDLVAARHVIVDLLADVPRRAVRGAVRLRSRRQVSCDSTLAKQVASYNGAGNTVIFLTLTFFI